jgi:hypothetical protein
MRAVCGCLLGAILLSTAANTAGAQTLALVCHGAQRPGTIAELLFGRDIGGHLGVSEAAWRRFVAREIAPRFPDGLTVASASGQWRDRKSGKIVREPSKLVLIALPGNADDQARLDAVVAAYKREFRQQSVGFIVQSACVSF